MEENIKEVIERLSMKAITSKLEEKDYPNCIVFKKDLINILNELERIQKENERLKEKHKITCELNVCLLENTKECIPKQVIRDKIEEIENSGIWITEDCFFDGETDNLICQQEFKKYEMEEYIINLLRKLLGE